MITGPSQAIVGDELAFVVPDEQVETWRVGGQNVSSQVLTFTPSSPGSVTVTANTGSGTITHTVTIDTQPSSLQIVGPGLLPLNQTTTLTVTGGAGRGLVWTLAAETYQQPTLDVRPTTPGLVTVQLQAENGAAATRTFTAG